MKHGNHGHDCISLRFGRMLGSGVVAAALLVLPLAVSAETSTTGAAGREAGAPVDFEREFHSRTGRVEASDPGVNGCPGDCTTSLTCGNGIVETGEECDDGNGVSSDGCTMDCRSNLLRNGDFAAGSSSWLFHSNGGDVFSTGGGLAEVSFSGPEAAGTNVQLYQYDVPLEPGQAYCLAFRGSHSASRAIDVHLFKHVANYTSYAPVQNVPLGPTAAAQSLEFTSTAAAAGDARLQFWLPNADAPGSTLRIDDVTLVRGTCGCLSVCSEPTCGDGTLDTDEQCDDGNLADGDGCSSTCVIQPFCGDGVTDAGEECDAGVGNSDTDPDACRTDCTAPRCGDGVIDTDEECDDGNTVDGDDCSSTCVIQPFCGDGVTDAGEECDAGVGNSDTDPDACRTDCTAPRCGDGVIDTDEECDDGNTVDGDDCSSTCVIQPFCGDGVTDAGEECDAGVGNSDTDPDACRTDCTAPRCGDGVIDTDEECDDGNTVDGDDCPSTCVIQPFCGDGVTDAGEECDAGVGNSDTDPDACRTDCTAPRCGDGVIDTDEECDDGNTVDGDDCSSTCVIQPFCGDGVTDAGEECDAGVGNSDTDPDACRTDCTAPRCGDGVIDTDEECDDGNTVDGDDCSATCENPPSSCGNGVVDFGEECDDANPFEGDGCTNDCRRNLIRNGDFAAGSNHWLFYSNGGDGFSVDGDEATVTFSGPAGAGTIVQLYQHGVPLEPNRDYCLSFVASHSASQTIQARFIKHTANYNPYAPARTLPLTPVPTRRRVQFETNSLAGSDARLQWWLAEADQDGSILRLDDVSLVAGECNCSGSCTESSCGNGTIDTGEQCDDGNTTSGDGCSGSCQIESDGSTNIDVWYGDQQVFGQLGQPQRWVNIPGNVSDSDGLNRLEFSLNGGSWRELTIGSDGKRLERSGDFNVEFDFVELRNGNNEVLLRATDRRGNRTTRLVEVDYPGGNGIWPLPYSVDWAGVNRIQDAAQVVDGLWQKGPDGVRIVQPGYDRLIAIGDVEWGDYEAVFSFTPHSYVVGAPRVPGLGLIQRWTGHTDWPLVCAQPHCGWQPHGNSIWYQWFDFGGQPGSFGGTLQDPSFRILEYGTTYFIKVRAEGNDYRFKIWAEEEDEPIAWTDEGTGQQNVQRGSLLLIVHYVDATIGDLEFYPLPDGAAPAAPTGLIAEPTSGSRINLSWDAAEDDVDVTWYRVYRDGVPVGVTNRTTFSDMGLAPRTTYSYHVTAGDDSDNESPATGTVQAVTPQAPAPGADLLLALGLNEGAGDLAVDGSGSGNDSTRVAADWTIGGRFGGGLAFDGFGDHVDLGGLDVAGDGLTIMAWFRADSFAVHDARLVSKSKGTDEASHFWMLSTVDGSRLRFRLKAGASTSTLIADSGDLTKGVWVHAAATYDGTKMVLYHDGVPVGELAKTGAVATDPAVPAWIGDNPTNDRGFHGVIDEVKIFRRALSQAEIQAEMTSPIVDPSSFSNTPGSFVSPTRGPFGSIEP